MISAVMVVKYDGVIAAYTAPKNRPDTAELAKIENRLGSAHHG